MSKSYGNVIPLLESEKNLRKSIMKIVTNSLEPGEPKDSKGCTVFDLYKSFASDEAISDFQQSYDDGISWGEAKEILFNLINKELEPIRNRYNDLVNDEDLINDLLNDGAKKARLIAKDKLSEIREVIGIKSIS
jgi:Tryptophanyl-tRNA synthetase